jgi:hypothetical protein
MFTLVAPPGIGAFQARGGNSYTVSPSGTITVFPTDLADAQAAGFILATNHRVVTAQVSGNVTLNSNDGIVEHAVTSGAVAGTITMPVSPIVNQPYTICDSGTNFGEYNQTLTPNLGQGAFLGSGSPILDVNGMSVDCFYNGYYWRLK